MSGFDAIDRTHRLEARGFSREQAEVLAQLFADFWSGVVTRQVLRDELTAQREDLMREVTTTARDLEQGLTIRLGGMLAVAVGVVSTIVHFWQ
ncbi:MAG TPA: hypothetical protein VE690_06295 [Rhodopila sp.]|nr:hypothetical protein [Rhodopila sp.]